MEQLIDVLRAKALEAEQFAEMTSRVIPTAHAAEVLVQARKLVAAVEILREASK